MCRVLRVARSGWYTWRKRRLRVNTRRQFRLSCDAAVSSAFHHSKQRYGAPRLADELRAQGLPYNVKTIAASLRWKGVRAKAVGVSARSATVSTVCRCQRTCCSRTSAPAARTKNGAVTSRTCAPMKAGFILLWSLTCGHGQLSAGQCRHG